MPELPEVETVRKGLIAVLEGRRITRAVTRRGDLRIPFPEGLAQRLTGRMVTSLGRRAKYILAALDSGETLVLHLGMSGRLSVHAGAGWDTLGRYVRDSGAGSGEEPGTGRHDHLVIETDAPARIVFTDPRRFGLATLIPTGTLAAHALFSRLGPEPLAADFTAAALGTALKNRKTPVKSALLDQRVIAGLGNIYVCEALWRAGISPRRRAARLRQAEIAPLQRAVRAVLEDALKAGGSSLRDFAAVDGNPGNFQHHFRVYDREGEACATKGCKGRIKRIVQAGRSTFYCPKCQK